MNTHWMVNTHGDPLGTLHDLLAKIWQRARLDAMLVPFNSKQEADVQPRLLRDPAQLQRINPFKPLMTLNAARLVPDLLCDYPHERLAVLLRPCEMRALIEMVKHDSFSLERTLTISVDCLGTFPAEDYLWRLERKGSSEKLTQEALHFARQGGIQAYRYRSACQFCVAPDAHGADINIGVLGLPARQYLTLEIRQAHLAQALDLQSLTDGPALPELLAQREALLARQEATRERTRVRLLAGLTDILPDDVAELVKQFENCGACRECLDVCPICSVDYPRQSPGGGFIQEDVMRWMVSCAGCGMCEQVCPNHKPLSAIFTHIRQQLMELYDYAPGLSLEEPLPV